MGKKKSVVLMVIISIVLVALTVFTVCPSFWFPWNDGLKGWNSVLEGNVDFGSDYQGGYYAYYYPEGVISEAEYKDNYDALKGDSDPDNEQEYADRYIAHKGLYLDKEAEFITESNRISTAFTKEMEKLRDIISERYSQKGYSEYSVSLVDDYALRVEIPATDANYAQTFQLLAETGALTIKANGMIVDELADEDADASKYIDKFSVASHFAYKYIRVKLTKEGAELLDRLEEDGSIVSQSADSSQDGSTGVWIYLGETAMIPVYTENVASDTVLKCAYNDASMKEYLQTAVIAMNSALEYGEFSFSFSDVSGTINIRSHAYGENAVSAMLIVLGALTLAAIALAIVLCKKYGVVFAYMACTYVSITGLSFAFIAKTVFEFTLGTAIVYVLGLALMLFVHLKNYEAIKQGVALGKTVKSSVALGYKKTLWKTVDAYVVLALGAVAMILGLAGVVALAWQTIICLVAGAFCNLLWGRVINYTYLAANKDKYKFYGLVREDDDDE